MKNYLTLAAFLGAIAFLSVSYLAQAEPEAVTTEISATSAPVPSDAAVPELTGFAKDFVECEALASAATTEGVVPTTEEKAATSKKCLLDKGHTEEMIAQEEANRNAVPAEAPAMEAPAAPAAE